MFIANLTTVKATEAQRLACVFDLEEADLAKVKELVSFGQSPSYEEIIQRADNIASFAKSVLAKHEEPTAKAVLIDPPSFMVSELEEALLCMGIEAVFPYHGKIDNPEQACVFKLPF